MRRRAGDAGAFIVNVSARWRASSTGHKTANHPHTNMAKAALNMMTATAAADYAADRIYMNSVDTGWINDENPLETAARIARDHAFQTPIDEEDAAARCLAPVIEGCVPGSGDAAVREVLQGLPRERVVAGPGIITYS